VTLPGYAVVLVEGTRARSARTQTGTAFFVGEAERGPTTPQELRSIDDFEDAFGGRVSYSYLYDSVDAFFRSGGRVCHVARVVSDTATRAGRNLSDGTATTLRIDAVGVGEYGNDTDVAVLTNAEDPSIPAGSFVIQFLDTDGSVAEATPPLATKAEALAYAAANWTKATLTDAAGTDDPVALAAAALSGGAANRGAITDAEHAEALARLPKDLGPGQVANPGRTTTAAHEQLLDHARLNNRHAYLDLPDSAVVATVIAAAQAADGAADEQGGRHGEAFWPFAKVPGLAAFSTRLVPWSAIQAGLAARSDGLGNPNRPVAGIDREAGVSQWAVGLSQDTGALTDAQREDLNDAGVNVVLVIDGQPTNYGNRTLRDPGVDPRWTQGSGSRLAMAIAAGGSNIIGRFVHRQIDGKGQTQGDLQGQLGAMLARLYDLGALYGETAQEAYSVDAGEAVNTPETIASGLLRAHVAFRASPGADRVELLLVRVAVTEAVA
jgi:hypothetical protein